jgi:NAD(P)-dependent dehydrogenase (short-subunit alcohol dehydrogenase family)
MYMSLADKVALVAGATRGAGRGIAVQLGAAGATVYVAGRSTRSQRSEMNRPETIEETASLADAAGGRGIAVRVGHARRGARARGPGRRQARRREWVLLNVARRSRGAARLATTLVCAAACAQQPLIENAALNRDRLHDVVQRASAASGLRVMTPLSVELVSRARLHELLEEEARAAEADDREATASAADAASRLGPPSEVRVELFSRVSTGAYLSRSRSLYLVSEPARGKDGALHPSELGDLGDEVTLAHEVVHALQHQHFPHLFGPSAYPNDQTDANAALQAAIEGSATLAAASSLGYLGGPRDPDEVVSEPPSAGALEGEHPLLRERFDFPYTYGYRLAHHDGWDLLESPPASTEQVIHLDWLGRRRPFLAIDLSDVRDDVRQHGCRGHSQDTMGELGVSLWLRDLRSETDANVAQGWDGDRWITLECNGEEQMAWLSSWDTDEDAIEFEQAIAAASEALERRYALSGLSIDRYGREVVVVSGGFPIGTNQIRDRARRARVITREELAAHFRAER